MIVGELAEEGRPVPADVAVSEEPLVAVTGAFRSLTAREIISALIRDGFSLHNQRGSHQRYRHADGRRVTVTYHRPGETPSR
jgi:predicted RNA binding protein YcfA (HicA-like mRNA interferase family)